MRDPKDLQYKSSVPGAEELNYSRTSTDGWLPFNSLF
jgi:hypothetical protein